MGVVLGVVGWFIYIFQFEQLKMEFFMILNYMYGWGFWGFLWVGFVG